ncbi:MAG TPA: right-handed parallel beta-helix repeat-containing protein, partial [Leptospiraceae bacterium]|nr:right-handed parallel beta-helix repeat-containing protein [Leptospiraceae bacterium]
MKMLAIIICFSLFGCLKAKKSPFDISSPSALFGSFLISSQNRSLQGTGTATGTGTGTGTGSTSFSVSGSISGFTAGTLILQNNVANDLTLTATNTYSFTGLASGSTYAITIKTNPTGFVCSIANASGTITANVTNANITCVVMTVNPAYTTNGLKWNDYINRDFTKDIFSQADTACNTANTGGYRTCVHAGEIRKFDIPSRSTCTGLTATDNLSALNWICKANSTTGGVSFYSTGLKKGKYLSDLIDWTNNVWQSLTITVKDGSTTHAVSNGLKLWTNLIDVTETINASIGGTIYIYKSNVAGGQIRVNVADKVAVVFKPGTIYTIGTTNSATSVIFVNNNFSWIEGAIDSKFYSYGIQLNGKFIVLKNLKIQNCFASGTCIGIYLFGASNNYLEDIVISNMGSGTTNGGLNLTNSSYNFLNSVSISNGAATGINYSGSSTNNTYLNFLIMNHAANGISFSAANDSIVFNVTSVNNTGDGINASSHSSFFSNIALVNNGAGGISGGPLSNPTVQNLSAISNVNGIAISGGLNYFYGRGMIRGSGNTSSDCQSASGFVGGLASGGCPISAPSDSISFTTTGSVVSSFVGKSAIDSKNASGLSGTSLTFSAAFDWVTFDTFFKSIGLFNANSFPHSLHRGLCAGASSCTIWDFSLKSTDTVLRNANITGGGSGCPTAATMFVHTWTAASQAACNSVIGATFNGSTCTSTILRNSIELINDGVGNDNGLCEANEDCLLTPN